MRVIPCVEGWRMSGKPAGPGARHALRAWMERAGIALLLAVGWAVPALGGTPIRIGEINSYSGIAAGFTGPYRQAVEMAVEEVNARGGILGRPVEVLFRDDKGNPADAIRQAQDLVLAEKVDLLAGTFLSNVGLAVSDFARQHRVLFVAAEPLTEALTWSQGNRYTFRVRPNTYSQGRILAERAGRLPYTTWAEIGPNYEYGRRAWETFAARLRELKPDVRVVGEQWPPLGKIEPGGYIAALLGQRPEAVYVSLFGTDWISFAREGNRRGLFSRAFFVGILLGEPEYLDPLGLEAPEGMLVTGYPWYAIPLPAHRAFVERFQRRTGKPPVMGSLVGYLTFLSIFEAVRQAGSTETERLIEALEGLSVPTPIGPITFRPFDHQSTMGAWVGTTKLDRQRGTGVMVDWEYVPGERVLPSAAEVQRMREASR
jgi:branched-chain amino acid transport system substrate-binding protein